MGTRSLTARYVGDQNYATSSSATTFVTISATSTSTTLASSANPAGLGRTVRLTATVSPSITVGTIRFLDAGIELGTCSLSDGTCAFEIGTLSAGTHSLTAAYLGNTNTLASTSAVLAQEIKVGASVALTATVAQSTYGEAVGFVATVTTDDLGLATGTIALMDGVTILDTCSLQGLDPNACSLTTSAIVAGTRSITARYLGDAAYAPAT